MNETGLTPCMGGWCTKRNHCPHYHSTAQTDPNERLCPPGQDGSRAMWLRLEGAETEEVAA